MNDEAFPRRFTAALRPGSYLRIIIEGDLASGDEIRVIHRPDHDVTIKDVFRIYTQDRNEVMRLVAVPQLSESWRNWAQRVLQRESA